MVKLLERAKAENVKFNPDKLQYKVKEVKHICNIVSKSGLKPDTEKVRAIMDMALPKSKKELQRFLGMVKFIPNQSTITDPLRQLLKQADPLKSACSAILRSCKASQITS